MTSCKKLAAVSALLFALAALPAFVSCGNSSAAPIPIGLKKTSDWLFLFYFDADDEVLNDDLYGNMREIEYALSQMRNFDGSPKANYPSVTALVLWDGISNELKGAQKYIHPDGALYELGPDYNLDYLSYGTKETDNKYELGYVALKGKTNLGDNFVMGANTIDWTAQARAAGLLEKEPNMADGKTLENFLKWAKSYYDAKNVVLCIDDHGAGPFKETYADTNAVSKSLCSDSTNGGERMLTCKNIKDALEAAGYVGSQKPKIIWNDVCLQSSAEVLWNYKDYADYFIASPNIAVSQDFVRILTSTYKEMTPRDFGKIAVSAYYERFYSTPNDCPKDAEKANQMRASGYSLFTLSLLSLDGQKAAALKACVENFAAALLLLKNGDAQKQKLFKDVFENYVDQDPKSFAGCKGLAYHGSYAYLSDLGDLALRVKKEDSLSALHSSADALLDFLKHGDDKLIVYAWAGKMARAENFPAGGKWSWGDITPNQLYLTGGRNFINDDIVAVERPDDVFGLTISGCAVYPGTVADVTEYYDSWFDFSTNWGEVIKAWKAYY